MVFFNSCRSLWRSGFDVQLGAFVCKLDWTRVALGDFWMPLDLITPPPQIRGKEPLYVFTEIPIHDGAQINNSFYMDSPIMRIYMWLTMPVGWHNYPHCDGKLAPCSQWTSVSIVRYAICSFNIFISMFHALGPGSRAIVNTSHPQSAKRSVCRHIPGLSRIKLPRMNIAPEPWTAVCHRARHVVVGVTSGKGKTYQRESRSARSPGQHIGLGTPQISWVTLKEPRLQPTYFVYNRAMSYLQRTCETQNPDERRERVGDPKPRRRSRGSRNTGRKAIRDGKDGFETRARYNALVRAETSLPVDIVQRTYVCTLYIDLTYLGSDPELPANENDTRHTHTPSTYVCKGLWNQPRVTGTATWSGYGLTGLLGQAGEQLHQRCAAGWRGPHGQVPTNGWYHLLDDSMKDGWLGDIEFGYYIIIYCISDQGQEPQLSQKRNPLSPGSSPSSTLQPQPARPHFGKMGLAAYQAIQVDPAAPSTSICSLSALISTGPPRMVVPRVASTRSVGPLAAILGQSFRPPPSSPPPRYDASSSRTAFDGNSFLSSLLRLEEGLGIRWYLPESQPLEVAEESPSITSTQRRANLAIHIISQSWSQKRIFSFGDAEARSVHSCVADRCTTGHHRRQPNLTCAPTVLSAHDKTAKIVMLRLLGMAGWYSQPKPFGRAGRHLRLGSWEMMRDMHTTVLTLCGINGINTSHMNPMRPCDPWS
ncbi:hypothetical protein ACRALDRAFT_211672 [Sodiomyces alcalophilus JCM 7366]|uniref:uncharacterized protein n=1 Tax=Sodiomyces alcalophilus JCM 7366 TaxID=591952 RepID=UPI0039B39B1A